jgi:hypothetical protein
MDKPKLGIPIWADYFNIDTMVSTRWNIFFDYHIGNTSDNKKQIKLMKIFVLDFSSQRELVDRVPIGHEITEEKEDGGKAYKTIGKQLPDKIFIQYKYKPSHGRQTAISIKERKRTSNIPIYFVDGNEVENHKVRHIGNCIKLNELTENV